MLRIENIESRPSLSGREQQILELVAVGLSAKEVALEIDIAPRTVERHIENIRLKLRARNRTHMVTCAAMAGMLTTGPALQPLLAPEAPVTAPVAEPHYAVSDSRQAYCQTGSVTGGAADVGNSAVFSGYLPLRLVS
jgi:LuxR family transcriptional regulator, transcriptional regulator of spore coat protein